MVQIWGEDVMEFANEIGAKQFYYTGVSHGTAAGWYIAFHQPHRLKALAAVSGVARHMIDRSKAPTFDDGIAGNEEKLRRVSWNTFYPTKDPVRLKRREARRDEHFKIMMRRTRDEFKIFENYFMNGRESDALSEAEFFRQLSGINVPVLLLNGIRDTLSTPEQAMKVASLIPGAKLIMYEHFEHAGPDECPEIVARDCDRFFRDIEGRIL